MPALHRNKFSVRFCSIYTVRDRILCKNRREKYDLFHLGQEDLRADQIITQGKWINKFVGANCLVTIYYTYLEVRVYQKEVNNESEHCC